MPGADRGGDDEAMLKTIRNVLIKLIGGTRNDRLVRAVRQRVVGGVNPLEGRLRAMSPEELLGVTDDLRARLGEGAAPESLLPEAFAAIREASRRGRDHRQFDVQLIAGQVLYNGDIAEEATGEGKTIACYPAIYLTVLQGKKVHVVTVNDYLVERDAEFARPLFGLLGVTVGYIQAHMGLDDRQAAYACDVTYGSDSEFGFDYLRDNTKVNVAEQAQGPLDFAIVDEVDNILIDEARTPLILSGPAYGEPGRYRKADQIARKLEKLQSQANRETQSRLREWGSEPPAGYASHPKFKMALKKFKADPSQKSGLSLTEEEAEALGHTQHFVVNAENKNASLTHEGVSAAQEDHELGAIYQDGAEWPHLITQSLRARLLYDRDRDYVVRDGEVVIVDEFTGRLMVGRQWSEGLHQAVEAKENVTIKEETQTMATITYQNYFKLYEKLAGMTGTAMTESSEFMKIFGLEVVAVPTHRPVNRMDHNDRIYRTEGEKFTAIVEEIRHYAVDMGRPVLVGTTSVAKSERLSAMLTQMYGIDHDVLNARPENAAREADIVAEAGFRHARKKGSKKMVGNVTIATNMAGRGTDIKLGPGVVNPHCIVPADEDLPEGVAPSELYPAGVSKCCLLCQEHNPATGCAHCFKPTVDGDFPRRGRTDCREEVPCGLHVVGTERHEARRIDNQLRGRSGRQGDPGSSRFFLCLEDDLMRIFAGPAVLKMLEWLGMKDGMAIEHKRISKGIERAQKRVEQRNFDMRKHLLDYDEIMDYQRKTFYQRRQQVLEGRDLNAIIVEMIAETVADGLGRYLGGDYSRRCICDWARTHLRLDLGPEQIRGEKAEDLEAVTADLRRRAREDAAADISRSIGEYIDPDLDRREWDLAALSRWAMSRYGVQLSQGQLRRMSPGEIEQGFIAAASERLEKIDLSPVAGYLTEDFARVALAQWVQQKFDIKCDADELTGEMDEVTDRLTERVMAAYRQREVEYPVQFALQRAFPDGNTNNVFHCNALADWVNAKYRAGVTGDDFAGKRTEEISDRLIEIGRQYTEGGRLARDVDEHLAAAATPADHVGFAADRFDTTLPEADLRNGDARETLLAAGRRFLRREVDELERFVLLQQYDGAWKDHLLGMDHLKSGIGLRGYAEQDPKIAYKREGSALFREMLDGVRDRVSENIFKVRLSAAAEVSSVYQISQMVHEQLAGYDHLTQEMVAQQAAGELQRVQTFRRDQPKVGRNDPCPCGSGKKYKKCCGQNV